MLADGLYDWAEIVSDVDLSTGESGVVTMRGGERWFCPVIRYHRSDDTYGLRYEDGWYAWFRRDGVQVCAGYVYKRDGTKELVVNHNRDVVAFEPCAEAPEGMEWGIHP